MNTEDNFDQWVEALESKHGLTTREEQLRWALSELDEMTELSLAVMARHEAEAERRERGHKKLLIWLLVLVPLVAYLLVWAGGNWSYDYTHACVRSHEVAVDPGDFEDQHVTATSRTVCDYTQDNGKRWTILGPIRSYGSNPISTH